MFRLRKDDEPVEWPVPVPVAQTRSGGKIRRFTFTAHFKKYNTEEIADYAGLGDVAFIEKILVGWGEDLKDADGQPVPFNDETRDYLARQANIKSAIIASYHQMVLGIETKNS